VTSPAFEVCALVKLYGGAPALAGVDFAARRGSVLAVLGPNGAGKTTAVRILATLVAPDSGVARVCGLDVVRHAGEVRRRIALTGQYAAVDGDLSGVANLQLVGELWGYGRRAARARAHELLEAFGLAEAAARRVAAYSGGMRRRLDLAACLVCRPEVVFLDEPTTGLDPVSRAGLWDAVRRITASGVTVLLTTQYLEEADALADRIVVISAGRVVAHGSPGELKRRTGGRRLTFVVDDPALVERAAQIVGLVSGEVERSGTTLSVPVADDAAALGALAALSSAGIRSTEFAVCLPSLDEVFHALTSRPVERAAS
jgi:oleandomycin transport system ATP-binding protein